MEDFQRVLVVHRLSATRAEELQREREEMESLTGINHPSHLLNLSLHYRPSFTKPISSFSLKTTSSRTTKSILRASASASSSSSSVPPPALNSKTQKENPLLETPKPISFLVKSTCVAILTAALVLARFNQPSIAAPIVVKPTVNSVDTTENEETKKPLKEEEEEEEEEELVFFGNLDELNDELAVLRELMVAKVKAKKFKEAISIIDQMLRIQPSKTPLLILRAHFLNISGNYDLAKLGYEHVLEIDPVSVEAYRGLMMLASSRAKFVGKIDNYPNIAMKIDEELVKRIESAIEICKKNEDVRDLKLLVVDIKIFEGKYTDALKINQELLNEAPDDSRFNIYQWYIYTLLGEEGEADIQFEKYKKLLPKELQEDACVFKEYMLARRKAFSQMVEILERNETVGSKR